MAAAFLKSIEVNNPDPGKYVIYILADKISKRNKNRLLGSTRLNVQFIDVTEALLNQWDLPDKVDYLPKTAYFRLMIPELFRSFQKVIYLDIDMLVLSNLERLWEVDLEDSLCLACQCFYAPGHRGQKNFRKLGIDEDTPYFNSGMLVIPVQKWRDFKVREKVNEVLGKKLNDPMAMDEEGLNVVLNDRWKAIDQRWNYPPHIADENNLPFIVHYIGYKPMYADYKTGLQNLFFYYLKDTCWEHEKKYGLFKKALIKGPLILKVYFRKLLA